MFLKIFAYWAVTSFVSYLLLKYRAASPKLTASQNTATAIVLGAGVGWLFWWVFAGVELLRFWAPKYHTGGLVGAELTNELKPKHRVVTPRGLTRRASVYYQDLVKRQDPRALAVELMAMGYRKTSNRHQLVSRIDNPNWQEAEPGHAVTPDFSRRVHSKDKLCVPAAVLKYIASSGHNDCGYVPIGRHEELYRQAFRSIHGKKADQEVTRKIFRLQPNPWSTK